MEKFKSEKQTPTLKEIAYAIISMCLITLGYFLFANGSFIICMVCVFIILVLYNDF